MTEQIKRPPMRNGDEYDALTPWRHRLCWRPGERSAIKRRFRRRERRLGKIKLTEFLAGDALSLRSGKRSRGSLALARCKLRMSGAMTTNQGKGMSMSVRAKFKVQRIERSLWRKGVEVQTIILLPVTSGSQENTQFYEATPSGEIKLGTVNADAAAQFELEGEYYVDFTKAE